MAKYKYAFQGYNEELMARAVGRDISASHKVSIEICNFLRHKNLQKAKQILARVIEKKQAVPYKRFTNGPGHKPGKMASGRYPIKVAGLLLKLLENVEINAQNKGLSTGQLSIIHFCSHQASKPMRGGRKGRVAMKRAHVEVVVQEKVEQKKSRSKSTAKVEAKPVETKTVKSEPVEKVEVKSEKVEAKVAAEVKVEKTKTDTPVEKTAEEKIVTKSDSKEKEQTPKGETKE
ncbi:50S ribosomal protein L22 [Candidatus Woesearchaeota archaeon]|jgi:large subunit ribosomal protein L22|nr:50S ribosomal protein L22 [Candidatus Woesearchaeota archaeon]